MGGGNDLKLEDIRNPHGDGLAGKRIIKVLTDLLTETFKGKSLSG
jgi:hypothetical protein